VTVPSRPVVVFGGDRAALVVAARLALDGHAVVLWQPPSAGEPLPVPCEQPRIGLWEAGGEREATLAGATTDPFEALAAADVLLACAATGDLAEISALVLPLIESRHTLVVLGGGLHALAAAKWLRDRGRSDLPTLAGSDTLPFAGLGCGADRLQVTAVATNVGFGVFPAHRTAAAMTVLADLFPGGRAHAHVVAAALATVEPMLREATLLTNLGAAARLRSRFSLFEDGFTPEVARVAEALDGERLALAAALGLSLPTSAQALHEWGLSPAGDLWAAVHGSFVLTRRTGECASGAGGLAVGRPFGMRVWVELAGRLGVPVPVAVSLAAIRAAADSSTTGPGWSLDDLGLTGPTAEAIRGFLSTGLGERAA
jgi:hypothetical protein